VKAAGDVKSPVTGTIVEVNESLNDSPESVNDDATGQGWFYKIEITDTSELDNLLSETTYNALIAELS
jgi:glycine cleavage system H protein